MSKIEKEMLKDGYTNKCESCKRAKQKCSGKNKTTIKCSAYLGDK